HAKNDSIDINPLAKLIGVWEGDKGIDVAPAQKKAGLPPGSAASSLYFEKIVITDGPGATNASEQDLVSVSYHQQVFRKSDNKLFHDQIGYWI
ncbi:heme-binding beta-barrel domain-containing protein, partial [Ralstonia pseudosolanacearum]